MADNNFINPSLIKEFIAEFTEHIQSLELNIIALEKEPGNLSIINDIFRSMHTLKGTSALLGFQKISEFGHCLENLLDELRKEKRRVTPSIIDVLLASLDIIQELIDDVALGGNGERVDTGGALQQIEALRGAAPEAAPPAAAAAPAKNSEEADTFLSAAVQHLHSITRAIDEIARGNEDARLVDNVFRAVHSLKASSSFMGFGSFLSQVQQLENVLESVRKDNRRFAPDTLDACRQFCGTADGLCAMIKNTGKDSSEATVPDAATEKAEPAVAENAGRGGGDPAALKEAKPASYAEQNIRVSMQKLDHLINLVSELLINKSRFDQIEKCIEEGGNTSLAIRDFKDTVLSMDRITGALHTAIMDARMVTVGTLFNRFPRTMRELARKKNKEIELVISGEETEIDKSIIEEINDPLLHLIRNAADHGLENPAARAAAGKPAQGTVFLRAFHESGNVIIEVEDDGKGMDTAVIKDKAVRNGIITPPQAEQLSEQEALNLIFLPGFSTAEEVTDISGRGVGMDVVKTNIEKLRGKIHIETEKGRGTKIILKLPLTMGMIETLMVNVGDEMFAIPILSVNTIARIKESDIQTVQGNEVVVLHGHAVETARLAQVLNVRQTVAREWLYLVVLEVKNTKGIALQAGFIVDSVQDKQKIVIKPLDDSIAGTQGFSGAAVLGDGHIALIIDPVELVDMVTRG